MRWLCFLLLGSPAAAAQSAGAPGLHFDLTLIPATRDSFRFRLNGAVRGWAVWQYEIKTRETADELLYTATSELQPVEAERLRVVLDRRTGAPLASFHHIDLFSLASDTVMLEHELDVQRAAITGRRRVVTKSGQVTTVPVRRPVPPGTVLHDAYALLAAAVTNAAPGESLAAPAYSEFGDSLTTLSFVGERPTTIDVPAGRFEVLALRTGAFRVYVTRRAPRRVVKGETVDGVFAFELVHSGPVLAAPE